MKFLLIALSLSVALFNQVLCNNVEVNQAEFRAINDTALKVFDTLMNAVDIALSEANVALNDVISMLNETVLLKETKAHAAISLAMIPINLMLNESITAATSLGLNLTKCESYVDELTDLPDDVLDEVVTCMTNQMDKAQGYADDAINDCKQIEQDMQTYASEISNCTGNILQEVECLAKLVTKMSADVITVPAKIAIDVTKKNVALITGLTPAVNLCADEKVAAVPIKGAAIVAKFVSCVGLPSNSTLPL